MKGMNLMQNNDTTPRRKLSGILDGDGDNLRKQWAETEAAQNFAPLPAGTYTAHVHNVELFNARTGTPGVKIQFRIAEGEHAGRMLFHDSWLTPAALPQTKRDCTKLGLDSRQAGECERRAGAGSMQGARRASA